MFETNPQIKYKYVEQFTLLLAEESAANQIIAQNNNTSQHSFTKMLQKYLSRPTRQKRQFYMGIVHE